MSAKSHIPTFHLDAGQKQQQQLSQRLIMSAHMQQAIHLLQLPVQELETFIEEQVVLNPILEIGEQEEEEEVEEELKIKHLSKRKVKMKSPSAIRI